MKKIIALIFLLAIINRVGAQDITGSWTGNLKVQASSVRIIFHIVKEGAGYTATMDSPDQGANGLATDKTTFTNGQLTISASKFGIDYSGTYHADSNLISGTFKQGPMSLPLTLTREGVTKTAMTVKKRMQDPVDYPYSREEVIIDNKQADVKLAGTLTMPKDQKAKRIVVLITGSGPQNRDEEIVQFNHRPFLVWSDWLTRQGIAVLRYDDRGIAKSTGNFAKSTSKDFASDANAAVEYIRSRADLKDLSIGLMGHSEGGMIAPMVATENKNVSFIILLAGPGVPIRELMIKQSDDQDKVNKTPETVASLNHQAAIEIFTYIANHKNMTDEAIKPELEKMLTKTLSKYPADVLGSTPINETIQKQVNIYLNPWFRYFISFNPADYLTKVKCPVLAINGTIDSQVSSKENLMAIRQDLIKAGNKHFSTVALENLNHMMQKGTTGAVSEYPLIEETVDQEALTTVSSWINGL